MHIHTPTHNTQRAHMSMTHSHYARTPRAGTCPTRARARTYRATKPQLSHTARCPPPHSGAGGVTERGAQVLDELDAAAAAVAAAAAATPPAQPVSQSPTPSAKRARHSREGPAPRGAPPATLRPRRIVSLLSGSNMLSVFRWVVPLEEMRSF